jgi:hypothetical protein
MAAVAAPIWTVVRGFDVITNILFVSLENGVGFEVNRLVNPNEIEAFDANRLKLAFLRDDAAVR